MAYAAVTDLQTRFKETLNSAKATAALEDAVGYINSYLGGSLIQVVGAVDRLRAYGGRTLYLGFPTSAVTAVTIEGETAALAPANYALRTEINSLVRIDGDFWPGRQSAWPYTSWVSVTRTRGFASGAYPRGLIAVNVSAAAQLYAVPPGATTETIGDYSISYQTGGVVQKIDILSVSDKLVLDAWAANIAEP